MDGNKDSDQASEVVDYFVRKHVTRVFKSFLEINDEIKSEHDVMLDKVEEKTSKEFAQNIDYFTPNKSEYFRKKILDHGNECIREILCFMDVFNLKVNEEKLDNLLNSKKIVRRDYGGITTIHRKE